MTKEIAVRPQPSGPVAFQVLGEFQMTVGGQPWELGPEQEQRMLVPLLDARGARVPYGRLTAAVWDDEPKDVRDGLYHLARTLRRRLEAAGQPDILTSINGTYRLAVPADCVDVHQFHERVEQAGLTAGQDDARAVDLLEDALRLHRGEPLAGMRGQWIDNYRHGLVEERRAVELALYEAAIRRGESRKRLPGLQVLFRERPQDEWVAWLLMHALYRAGRQPDALAVRQEVAKHLDTVAVTSLKPLGDLYERILRQDDDLLRPEALSFPADTAGVRARALGRAGAHVFRHQDRGEGNAMNGAQHRETEDERTIAIGRLREGEPDAGLPPQGESDLDGHPAEDRDPADRTDSRPQTSVVINGSVRVGGGGVIGTQNNYGRSR